MTDAVIRKRRVFHVPGYDPAAPDAVKQRTEAYKAALPERCAKRQAPEAASPRAADLRTGAAGVCAGKPINQSVST